MSATSEPHDTPPDAGRTTARTVAAPSRPTNRATNRAANRAALAPRGAPELLEPVLTWYDTHGRDLPWRRPEATPWGVFVSEVMSQQTPLSRVEPRWVEWLTRWPTPAALAADSPGEAVRAWDRLGYPRRALRLHEAATAIVRDHGGQVPADLEDLLALPGVGAYTAAAVAAFAYGRHSVVVDTNVRRVQARAVTGAALAAPTQTAAEVRLAATLVPDDPATAARWNVAIMELGALVCTARAPACERCPIRTQCAWQAAGAPPDAGPPRRGQAWHGTDRQIRGRILALLREAPGPLPRRALQGACPDEPDRFQRCLAGLVEDHLIEPDDDGPPDADDTYRLPH